MLRIGLKFYGNTRKITFTWANAPESSHTMYGSVAWLFCSIHIHTPSDAIAAYSLMCVLERGDIFLISEVLCAIYIFRRSTSRFLL